MSRDWGWCSYREGWAERGSSLNKSTSCRGILLKFAVYCLNQIPPAFSYNWITGLFSTITRYPATRIHSKREKRENWIVVEGLTKGWRRADEGLTKGWRRADEGLTKGWRSDDEGLTKGWRRADEGLTKGWRRAAEGLTKGWRRADEGMTKGWRREDEGLTLETSA